MPTLRQAVDGDFLLAHLIYALIDAASDAAARARQPPPRVVRRGQALTLRPGPDTPLWNQLVRLIRPHLRRRGNKAQLARLLGLPRQRLQDALKSGSASFDAERTLMLVGWLGFFKSGGQLVPVVRLGRPIGGVQPRRPPGNL